MRFGRTLADLARATGLSQKATLKILRQLEGGVLAEADDAGWRLSAEAERQCGPALRLIDEWMREVEEEARAA